MIRRLLPIVLILTLLLTSCFPGDGSDAASSEAMESEPAVVVEEATRDNTLEVFMVGAPYSWGDQGDFYTTNYLLGSFSSNTYVWGERGHIYYSALNNFQSETELNIHITYGQAHELWTYLDDGNIPDLIVSDTRADISEMMAQEQFLDLLPYFENDGIYTEGKYVNQVLKAGMYNDHQYVFPLVFSMNSLLTSKESLERHDLFVSRDQTYNELLTTFTDSYNAADHSDDTHFLKATDPTSTTGSIYQLFAAASGQPSYDPKTGSITLDRDLFEKLALLYEAFCCYDFQTDRAGLKELALTTNNHLRADEQHSRYFRLFFNGTLVTERFDLSKDVFACFGEGGGWGFDLHSTLTQAYYYESCYRDAEEEFQIIGIPEKNDPDAYSAIVTMFGVIPSGAAHPDEAYELLKILANSEIFPHFGMSINRDRLNESFEYYTSTYYDYYSMQMPDMSNELAVYRIQPMTQETSAYLQEMVDNIGTVVLPNMYEQMIIENAVEGYVYGNIDTLDAAYEQAVTDLETYYSGTLTADEEYELVWQHGR